MMMILHQLFFNELLWWSWWQRLCYDGGRDSVDDAKNKTNFCLVSAAAADQPAWWPLASDFLRSITITITIIDHHHRHHAWWPTSVNQRDDATFHTNHPPSRDNIDAPSSSITTSSNTPSSVYINDGALWCVDCVWWLTWLGRGFLLWWSSARTLLALAFPFVSKPFQCK